MPVTVTGKRGREELFAASKKRKSVSVQIDGGMNTEE